MKPEEKKARAWYRESVSSRGRLWVLGTAWVLSSCSDSGNAAAPAGAHDSGAERAVAPDGPLVPGMCRPGESVPCIGFASCAGTKVCLSSGAAYSTCACPNTDASVVVPRDASSDGSTSPDASVAHDGATDPPGWIVIDDLVGSLLSPSLSGHFLNVRIDLPHTVHLPSYTDADYSGALGAFHGCKRDYFSVYGDPKDHAPYDLQAGPVNFSGNPLDLLARNYDDTYVASPLSPLVCTPAGHEFGNYTCDYGYHPPWTQPEEIFFPTLVRPSFVSLCPSCACDQEGDGSLPNCEQHPLGPLGTAITTTIDAARGYPGASATIDVPGTFKIISASGSPPGDPADPLMRFDLMGAIDAQKDQTVTWSCDGSDTPGSGCPTGPDDVVFLVVENSTNDIPFMNTTDPQIRATCAEPAASGSLTLSWRSFGLPSYEDKWLRAELSLRKLSTSAFGPRTLTFGVGHGYFTIQQR